MRETRNACCQGEREADLRRPKCRPRSHRSSEVPVQRCCVLSSDPPSELDSHRSWRGVLDVYAAPRLSRSLVDLATSVVPYLALLVAMVLALRVSVWLCLLLVVPAAGF